MAARPRFFGDADTAGQRLLGALVVSLLAHLSAFSLVELGHKLNWWDSKPFQMFRSVRITPEELQKIQEHQRQLEEQRQREQPMMFVQVTEPSEETPPESKYYSSLSSRAANPDPGNENQPRIDGRQNQTLRTADAPRVPTGRPTPPPNPEPPGPADASPETPPPVPKPVPITPPAEVPKLVETQPEPAKPAGIGDLALVRPEVKPVQPKVEPKPVETPVDEPTPATPTPPAPRARPRTVTEAKIRQALLAGEKMKQDGGVARRGPVQLDVKGLPFGAYDEALIMAVQNRWYALLDERRFAGGVSGRVVVSFRLHADGSVRSCEASDTSVDPLFTNLCVRAISDPAPYEKWPSDMARMIGSNVREMKFTFFYN